MRGLPGAPRATLAHVRLQAVIVMCARTFKQGDWTCGECGASPVFASRKDCFRCGAPRPSGAWEERVQVGSRGAPEFRREFAGTRGSQRDEPEFRRDFAGTRGSQRDEPEFRRDFAGTRCFIENLSYETDWRELKDAFASEGYPIVYASVSTERDSGRSKGHGIVQFETAHAAEHAIAEMTGYELDGCTINVRPDFQEGRQRGRSDENGGGETARGATAWRNREWRRVAGSDDGMSGVDDAKVAHMLAERDAARDARDFTVADRLLDELADLGVSLDDAQRQRVWWIGRRADGRDVGGRGAAASRGRRSWHHGSPTQQFDGW
jgi:hypothetical protein